MNIFPSRHRPLASGQRATHHRGRFQAILAELKGLRGLEIARNVHYQHPVHTAGNTLTHPIFSHPEMELRRLISPLGVASELAVPRRQLFQEIPTLPQVPDHRLVIQQVRLFKFKVDQPAIGRQRRQRRSRIQQFVGILPMLRAGGAAALLLLRQIEESPVPNATHRESARIEGEIHPLRQTHMDRPATGMQQRSTENPRPLADHHLRRIVQRIVRPRRHLLSPHHHRRSRVRLIRRMAQVVPDRLQIPVRHHRRRKRRHDRRVSLALRRPRLSDRQILLRVPNRFRKILAICPHHHLRPTRRHQHLPLPRLRQKQIV